MSQNGLSKKRGAEAKVAALLSRPNKAELLEKLLLQSPEFAEILTVGFCTELRSKKRSRKVRGELELRLDRVLRGSRPFSAPVLVKQG